MANLIDTQEIGNGEGPSGAQHEKDLDLKQGASDLPVKSDKDEIYYGFGVLTGIPKAEIGQLQSQRHPNARIDSNGTARRTSENRSGIHYLLK